MPQNVVVKSFSLFLQYQIVTISFLFFLALDTDIVFGPGCKYKLPDIPRGPFFSIKWRTKLRKPIETPGPYYIKPIADAPAFSMYIQILSSDLYLFLK